MCWKKLCMLCLLAGALALPVAADDMPESEKVIYLTFDDGPSLYTPRLLELLEQYDARATFFLVNTPACSTEMLQAIVRGGHSIGIHSMSHDFRTIYGSEEAYLEDLSAMQNLIREKIGVNATLVRFPGGSSNTVSRRYCKGIMSRLVDAVTEAGFSYFDWNVDSGDAAGCLNTEQISRNVIAGIRGKERAVVLLHDVYPCSVEAVERILRWGQRNGYRFERLTARSPACHHTVQN